jgi:hypothetical protein
MYRLKQMGSKQGGNVLIYIRSDCVLLLYIDDCLLFSLKVAILDSILAHLDKVFNITIKHDVSAYLDLDVSHNTDNHSTISHFSWWTQKQIHEHHTPSDKNLQAFGPNDGCASTHMVLQADHRMLNYIAASSHPGTSFAIHQCTRFSSNPQRSHKLAVKCIIHYLKGTKYKGYILHP